MNMEQLKVYLNMRIRELGDEILDHIDCDWSTPQFTGLLEKRKELLVIQKLITPELLFAAGETVRIRDAMNSSLVGKLAVIEEISSYAPYSCKLTIDGQPGSWASAWLFSMIEKVPTITDKEEPVYDVGNLIRILPNEVTPPSFVGRIGTIQAAHREWIPPRYTVKMSLSCDVIEVSADRIERVEERLIK